jgi:hypothetical protein
MPPPAAAEVAVAQFADPPELLLGELLLLPHPAAASIAQPSAAATATPLFFIRTFPPPTYDHVGSGTRASSRGKVNKRYLAVIRFLSDE